MNKKKTNIYPNEPEPVTITFLLICISSCSIYRTLYIKKEQLLDNMIL